MATSKQSETAAFDVIRLYKFILVFFFNTTLNVNIKFLKIAMLEPNTLHRISVKMRSLEVSNQKIFNNSIKLNINWVS